VTRTVDSSSHEYRHSREHSSAKSSDTLTTESENIAKLRNSKLLSSEISNSSSRRSSSRNSSHRSHSRKSEISGAGHISPLTSTQAESIDDSGCDGSADKKSCDGDTLENPVPKPSFSFDWKKHAVKADSPSSSGTTSRMCQLGPPVAIQYGLIHAAFVEQSKCDATGKHSLPIDSLVTFAFQILRNSSMLNSIDDDSEKFTCSRREAVDAVEPLRLFVSSSAQTALSIEFNTFARWLEKSCSEILEKRLSTSNNPKVGSDSASTEKSRDFSKSSRKNRLPRKDEGIPVKMPRKIQSEESPQLVDTRSPKKSVGQAKQGEGAMLGMVLSFPEDDEVSVLTTPSVGPIIQTSKSVRTRDVIDRKHSSSSSSSRSSSSSSSNSSGTTISNPPVVSKSKVKKQPILEMEQTKNVQNSRRQATMDVLEEASHEDSDHSSSSPPMLSGGRSIKKPASTASSLAQVEKLTGRQCKGGSSLGKNSNNDEVLSHAAAAAALRTSDLGVDKGVCDGDGRDERRISGKRRNYTSGRKGAMPDQKSSSSSSRQPQSTRSSEGSMESHFRDVNIGHVGLDGGRLDILELGPFDLTARYKAESMTKGSRSRHSTADSESPVFYM
jgi:hypothetical protein